MQLLIHARQMKWDKKNDESPTCSLRPEMNLYFCTPLAALAACRASASLASCSCLFSSVNCRHMHTCALSILQQPTAKPDAGRDAMSAASQQERFWPLCGQSSTEHSAG